MKNDYGLNYDQATDCWYAMPTIGYMSKAEANKEAKKRNAKRAKARAETKKG